MSDSKNFEVIAAAAERLSVSPGRSYRTWSREEKERIVGETFAPGANVRRSRALTGSIHRNCLPGGARRWPPGWSRRFLRRQAKRSSSRGLMR